MNANPYYSQMVYCIYWKISAYAYFPKGVRHRRLFFNRSLFQIIHLFYKGLPSVSNMGLHSLHTVRFYELCQNPFVTNVARTLHGESLTTYLDDPVIHSGDQLNLPTAFWGLLGPQKDVNVNFTKNVGKQTAISF